MKTNIDPMKKAGCLMVAALLTYLSLGSASWAITPQEQLAQLKDKKIRTDHAFGIAKIANERATEIRENHLRGTPAPDTEEFAEQRKKGFDKTLAAEEWLKTHDQLAGTLQTEIQKTKELRENLKRDQDALLIQPGNRLPAPETEARKKHFRLQRTIGNVVQGISDSESKLQKLIQERPRLEEDVEVNEKHFGVHDLPPK
jgi:hypothetical protein